MKENYEDVVINNAESIISEDNNKKLEYNQKYIVSIPNPENKIVINNSTIMRIKDECKKAKSGQTQYSDLLLGVASLFLGAFVSAIISQIEYKLGFLNILFYTICPTLGIGFGVAYYFKRKKEDSNVNESIIRIERELENIQVIEREEIKDEH